jgi:ATPases involved in chromosome partitioning
MKNTLPLVLSVTSGKGGVGKTNFSVNLACCLAKAGRRVVLLDADLGLANVDVLLGLAPKYNLFHLLHDGRGLSDVLTETPYGFSILPAPSGVSEMLALSPGEKISLLEAMDGLDQSVEYLIVDTAAGINENVLYFNMASQERIVVVTPEPTSLTDAYAFIKVMQQNHDVNDFRVVINVATTPKEGKDIFSRLYKACDHFLSGVSLDLAGIIPKDPAVRKAVIAQKPFCALDTEGPAAKAVAQISKNVQTWEVPDTLDGNIKFFWKRLLFHE